MGEGGTSRGTPSPARGDAGRTVLEAVIVLLFVLIAVLTAASRYSSSIKTVQETALSIELGNLRSAINFYAVINGRLPASLKSLIKEKVIMPRRNIIGRDYEIVVSGRYVEGMAEDADGQPLDPFGSRYEYDQATGVVHTSTKGYETW
ncbi:MAG: hypothetical protein HZB21_01715 [Deltaproteobacteria bacterium]|nr:hypothetical protein [Deltaproteobacteria bacterium]MBI5809898.1 hypothetical protein [Deltaproteobacteria bacterium]